MTKNKRGNVWLGVSGLVVNESGEWLVVKKRYGGLEGKWSLPAGFVEQNETADEAALREVKEETGIDCINKGLIGLRTGVIKEEISDNMLLFLLEPIGTMEVQAEEKELYEAKYVLPDKLLQDEDVSVLLRYLIDVKMESVKQVINGINPGDQFGYSAYKLFL
ncbi:NUDIX domain-containing protein [Bacillus sp. CGMCC 1.16607]|uniref:NUDIX domain-containing protein n=1 Tax=Bacillus sp. CGMCC 1.16607 TaxID=3351842 RepID=UPI0036311117